MSDPKLISPMLDNFQMGGPISEHNGVCCCPAMRKDSDEKFIVKIISVPASQTQIDALLLTGAYTDRDAALVYFRKVANGIIDEKKTLDALAQLEGFLPFEDCQIVSKDDGSGYDVYLLSTYKKTLERHLSRETLTQLGAVNLGLDLCSALSVCRQSGYLCVDLKPSNIYVTAEKEFKIGDLGFIKLSSLKYASLPDMYRSSYTAPEVADAFASLNDKLDVYSAGLILYQVFNDGQLPFSGDIAPNEKFEAPVFADDEMAAIILKACDPDPAERWDDPVQMGQAIVNYMQKNGVNDTPLTAEFFGKTEEVVEEPLETMSELDSSDGGITDSDAEIAENTAITDSNEDTTEEVDADNEEGFTEDIAALITSVDQFLDEPSDENVMEETAEEAFDSTDEDLLEEETAIDTTDESQAMEECLVHPTEEDPELSTAVADNHAEADADAEEEYDNLSFLDDWDPDSDQILADMEDDIAGVSEEISEILNQIEELTSHEIPAPIAITDTAVEPVSELYSTDSADSIEQEEQSVNELAQTINSEEILDEEQPYTPQKKRSGLIWCIILVIVAALAVGAYFFYTQFYLQPIHSLELSGSEDKLLVTLTADIDESMLSVTCADSQGHKIAAPVVGGVASFSGLTPDAAYTVTVEVDGLHQITGITSKVYSTPIQTKITQMNAITGSEDGSVILNFTVDGPDSEQWNVIYSAEGEAERITAFPAHMVTLTGLTVGKEYTLRLEPVDDIYLAGNTSISFIAQNLITAANLQIVSCVNGQLSAQWDVPEGATTTEWSVRCYNENGYDQTLTTADTFIVFEDVDDSVENIIEVTAANMSVSQRVLVSANSVTISDFAVNTSRSDVLNITWNANREIPADGWNVRYTVNGISAPSVLTTNENRIQIPVVPNGNYNFTILDNSGNSVLGGPFTYVQGSSSNFVGYAVSKDYMTTRLCKTPASSSWSYLDLSESDYVNTFSVGDKISVVLTLSHWYEISDDEIITTFAIYDEAGNLVNFSHFSSTWKFLWYQNYCELDIPSIPAEIGTYEVFVYFNGAEVGSQKFEITA